MASKNPWVHAIQRLDLWPKYLDWIDGLLAAGEVPPQENAKDWLVAELDEQNVARKLVHG